MSSNDIAITVRGVSKSYQIAHQANKATTLGEVIAQRFRHPFHTAQQETFWALQGVSFDVKRGEVVGIIGRNGAGKSTLLKILSRITEPTSGEIDLHGRVGSLLEVGTGFHPELTGRENVYLNGGILGMSRREIAKQFSAIVEFAEVEKFLDTPVKRYSSGMYVRLAFAVAAHLEPEILIIDEVLAVGDQQFQAKCLGKMREVSNKGRTVLFVSHNMGAVQELCTSAIWLAKGAVQATGAVNDIIRQYLDQGATNEAFFERGPVRHIWIGQEESAVVLAVDWVHDAPLRLPNLGFVIYDYAGIPVVGVNPHLMGIDRAGSTVAAGRIMARMTEPRLLDGTYYLSIWFGDGVKDFIELPKCVSFEIRGMAGSRQLPSAVVGPVAARCEFSFDTAVDKSSDKYALK